MSQRSTVRLRSHRCHRQTAPPLCRKPQRADQASGTRADGPHPVPRTRHNGRAPGTLPDTITLYRIPILAVCARAEDVPDRVLKVLGHEVGHALGMTESQLRGLGRH